VSELIRFENNFISNFIILYYTFTSKTMRNKERKQRELKRTFSNFQVGYAPNKYYVNYLFCRSSSIDTNAISPTSKRKEARGERERERERERKRERKGKTTFGSAIVHSGRVACAKYQRNNIVFVYIPSHAPECMELFDGLHSLLSLARLLPPF